MGIAHPDINKALKGLRTDANNAELAYAASLPPNPSRPPPRNGLDI